ncbi:MULTISPECIES: LysE family translocator [Vreelandella]|uniref:LysE family translocator n=2 Tax=Vreelandella TaxID=3137766 RepID=A0A7C9JTT4_9GAMM|nr:MULTISPECIES: LysE family translocator [Halomonas]NDL71400.1 LysE family translocator [Halomonas alkaliphila]NYS45626.1 LysE family translocator [Halomonas zhaodongensis]
MEFGLFIGALAIVYLIPGPDMLLVLHTSSTLGRGHGLATALGLAIARGAHVALAGLGLAALFIAAPWLFDVVRYVGAAYLVWLALQFIRTQPRTSINQQQVPLNGSYYMAWRRGLLTNLLNPKSLLFCSVLLPQFVHAEQGSVPLQFTLLGIMMVSVGLLYDAVYACIGAKMQRWVAGNQTKQKIQNWVFGTLLIGFALRLAS